MSCLTAVIVMSSCTVDNIDDAKIENSINSKEVSIIDTSPGTTTTPPAEPNTTSGVDDKDKTKT